MPKFRVRLESPDMMRDNGEPHFRVTTLTADDEDMARAFCEAKEAKIVMHQYPADDLAEMERIEEGVGPTPGAVRGRLAAHRQILPYEIAEVEQIGGGPNGAA